MLCRPSTVAIWVPHALTFPRVHSRRNIRRFCAPWWAVGLALASVLAGCAEPVGDQPIRFGLASAAVTLDPRFATDATSSRVNRLLYARLVDFDEALRPTGALASWQRLTPRHYRFRLRETRRSFADGTPLTAGDVKATYDDILDEVRGSPHRATLKDIAAVKVVDVDTVDFFLKSPDLLFPGKLVVGIMPGHLLVKGHPFNTAPVGSGPFGFVAWPEENRLRLKRHRDGQAVELLRVSDPNTRVLKILNGELDLLQGDLSPEIIRWLEARDGIDVSRARGTKFAYLGFNLEDPVVGQLRIRQAIAYAVNREEIIRYVMGRAARPASSILPSTHWAGDPGLRSVSFDLGRAKALLLEAGYSPGKGPKIVYKTSAAPFRIRLATIIQDQLSRAGFDVDVHSHDWGTFYADVKAGRFQMYSLAWVGIKMPDIFRYVFHSDSIPPHGANRGRFRSARADGLIESAEHAATFEAQASHYRALQRHVLEELPYVPLWYEDNVKISIPGLSGYELNADGNYDGLDNVKRAG